MGFRVLSSGCLLPERDTMGVVWGVFSVFLEGFSQLKVSGLGLRRLRVWDDSLERGPNQLITKP